MAGYTLPKGYTLKTYQSLESTSDEAKRLAHEGVSAGLWVVAEEQTKGRGRHGRNWVSGEGNLYASLLLYPACDLSHIPELSFVAAVAVAGACRHFCPDATITCKWPNDILIGGKKAAGILLESESSGNPQKPWVVIGIGINVVSAPEGVDYPAAALGNFEAGQVFEVLALKMAEALVRWGKDGFGPIRTLWLNQAHGRGDSIRIESGGEIREGVFEGLSATGALLLREKQGTLMEILSGTVLKD